MLPPLPTNNPNKLVTIQQVQFLRVNQSLGKVLGKGTFGKVRQAIHKPTGQKVAIKFLEKKQISEVSDVERVTREIHILKLIRHPNLIQMYEIIETPKQLLLIMEFSENGELFDYIVKKTRIKEDQAKKMFHQIIDGVEYIHKLGIAHRDLKPENILLDYKNSLKIIDFGLGNTYKVNNGTNEKLKTPCGSPCYAAPEMVKGETYQGLKVDIWSCGIILFAMVCGYLPFEDQNVSVLYKKVTDGEYTFHRSASDSVRDLIRGILNNDPKTRYSIEQIRKHPWMMQVEHSEHRRSNQGIRVGYNRIPIDENILRKVLNYKDFSYQKVERCLEANRHNQCTVCYYLEMRKFLRNGGKSACDMESEEFDQMLIEPIPKSKNENHTQVLLDNFFTKNSSSPLDNNSVKIERKSKKPKVSRERVTSKENKQNIGYLINKKKPSKQKSSAKDKSKSRIVFKDHHDTSHLANLKSTTNAQELYQTVERKSQNNLRRLRQSTTRNRKDQRSNSKNKSKLDSSINFGRIPLTTKSIERNSGRQSEHQSTTQNPHHCDQRPTVMENRVSRKYKQKFNQSLISHSKNHKLASSTATKTSKGPTTKSRSRINSSTLNNQTPNSLISYQGFNTTTIAQSVTSYTATNTTTTKVLNKKCKDMDNSGYIEEYLMKGKKSAVNNGGTAAGSHRKTLVTCTMANENPSIKALKSKRM